MSCMQHHFSSGRSSRKARKPEREGREGRRWPFDQLGVLSRGCRRLGREGGREEEEGMEVEKWWDRRGKRPTGVLYCRCHHSGFGRRWFGLGGRKHSLT
ncbi:hypothetical protein BHE74_00013274 [Ensete ventricosum]|nr:hypothetical protein BHE74_00013274 [Ensete ventricosum]